MTREEDIPLTSEKHTSSTMHGMAAGLLQSFKPVKNHDMLFNSLHCYAADPRRQVESNHYCGHLTEDVRQCLIYDHHDTYRARLIGVEYIISRAQFQALPADEKPYWHSHAYEVASGLLVMPGVPEALEDAEMRKLGDTYGKTWHFWQVDRGDPLPYGPPQLMASFTEEHADWLNQQMLQLRDDKLAINSAKKRAHRHDKYARDFAAVLPGADQMLDRSEKQMAGKSPLTMSKPELTMGKQEPMLGQVPGKTPESPSPTPTKKEAVLKEEERLPTMMPTFLSSSQPSH